MFIASIDRAVKEKIVWNQGHTTQTKSGFHSKSVRYNYIILTRDFDTQVHRVTTFWN